MKAILSPQLKQNVITQVRNYLKLMRVDRPIGIWLLLWPTLWALWLAGDGHPDQGLFVVFTIGVFIMRSAGCVLNDYVDRKIDPYVERTRSRPIASGAVMPGEALVLFVALSLIAGAVPMAFAAQTGETPQLAWLVFGAAVIWAVIYDTFYAMVDREDDRKIGVKSTAILFGEVDLFVIAGLQLLMLVTLVFIGLRAALGFWYYLSVAGAAGLMAYHLWLARDRQPAGCFAAFLQNHYIGLVVFIGIILHYSLSAPAPVQ
jgi:4-hydroxybenzoate polyprenyltransferase